MTPTTTMTFSLLTEPWIPLLRSDGARITASITDALINPSQWQGIDSTNPVECLALHRLLLAICHRAIGPGDTSQRAALLDTWPSQLIATYLEQWADRFNLFDPINPFLQTPALVDAGASPKPLAKITTGRSAGANRVFWDHSIDDTPIPVASADAARALVACQQFTTEGLVRFPRSSGSRGPACGIQIVIPTGQTLQHTLALNLTPQAADQYAVDLPAWEQAPPVVDDYIAPAPVVPAGPAMRYSWLSRLVHLIRLDDGTVAQIYLGAGGIIAPSPIPDPMAAVISGRRGPMPLLVSVGRSFWRDFHALTGADGSVPPATVQHATTVCMSRGQFDPINLLAGGIANSNDKIHLWRLESREVAPALLSQGNAVAVIQTALDRAEATGAELNKAIWSLCSSWLSHAGTGSDPDKKVIANLRDSIQVMPQFWGALEPEFWSLVHQLGDGLDHDAALHSWADTLKRAVRSAQDHACTQLGRDGRALAAAARSGAAIGRSLAAAAGASAE